MPTLAGMQGDVYFGSPDRPLPDWRALLPEADSDDDEPSEEDCAAAIGILGFDPRQPPVAAPKLSHRRLSKPVKSAWQPYVGKLGSRKGQPGWKHGVSGRVVWGAKPPESRTAKAPAAKKPAIAKPAKPTVEGTKASIADLKNRGEIAPEHIDKLAAQLAGLTVKELGQLKAQLGIKASGVKSALAKKIAERALQKERLLPVKKSTAKESERANERRTRSEPAGKPAAKNGGSVAKKTERTGDAGDGRKGADGSQPARPATAGRIPASVPAVSKRLDRFEKLFRDKGQHEVANWMGMLRAHVQKVGSDAALAALGAEGGPGDRSETQYEGRAEDMGAFCEAYLNRNGITMIPGGGDASLVDPQGRVISSQSNKFAKQVRPDPYIAGDFSPKDPTFKDKLQEAKHLPGLESSEDINVLAGKKVTHLTPDVLAKMDEKYGAGKWIVKAYGDIAFAGNGIYFPQRAAQIPLNARNAIWDSGAHLARYGFHHLRDEAGTIVGIEHSGGDQYRFGTEKYERTIQGDARQWADKAAAVAADERAAALPDGGKDFMAQPAFPVVGVSDADRAAGRTHEGTGEGRVHIVTRNGKAEVVPHSTWIKGENLPVVFEDDGTRGMAQAAVNAINALPQSERNGQIYAPDIVRTADGYRVVEANPANETGSSGYLGDNPFIVDAYVSHLTNREPAHVRFIRNLLSVKKRGRAAR